MIIDETAGSGGDLLPWMFRKFKLGKLIGRRTWGGLVGTLGFPVLMGASRKSFVGSLQARGAGTPPGPKERDPGSMACSAFGHVKGVSIHRVHNVGYASALLRTLLGLEGRPGQQENEERGSR